MFATIKGISRNRAQTMANTVPNRKAFTANTSTAAGNSSRLAESGGRMKIITADDDEHVMEKDDQILPDDPQDVYG